MTELVIVIPGTPPSRLSPNGTRNTWERHRLAQEAKGTAYTATLAARWQRGHALLSAFPGDGPIAVSVVIGLAKGRRRLDDDGASGLLKSTQDGIAQALGVNDRRFRLDGIIQERDKAGVGFVRYTLRAME